MCREARCAQTAGTVGIQHGLFLLRSIAQAANPISLQERFIHKRHRSANYDTYEILSANIFRRCYRPRLRSYNKLVKRLTLPTAEGIRREYIRGGRDPLAGGTRTGCSITPRTSHVPVGLSSSRDQLPAGCFAVWSDDLCEGYE
jgi:hypothetical protein